MTDEECGGQWSNARTSSSEDSSLRRAYQWRSLDLELTRGSAKRRCLKMAEMAADDDDVRLRESVVVAVCQLRGRSWSNWCSSR